MSNGSTGLALYAHKRSKHATKKLCPNGGPDGRRQFNLPAGTSRCPFSDCRGELMQVNTGVRVVGQSERRARELERQMR
jgi:hypothetical protein